MNAIYVQEPDFYKKHKKFYKTKDVSSIVGGSFIDLCINIRSVCLSATAVFLSQPINLGK